MALVIKNGKSTQTLTFGYLCLRNLGEKWNLAGVQSVINRVVQIFSETDANDIGFNQIDVLVDIVNEALPAEAEKITGDWILKNPEQIAKITKDFIDSLPKPDTEKKNQAPKK